MNRRAMIATTVATAGMLPLSSQAVALDRGQDDLARLLSECNRTGQQCLQHCQEQMSKGRKDFAECAHKVMEMDAVCAAMGKLVNYKSKLASDQAKVCVKSCEMCMKACKQHEKHWSHHKECKACYVACEKAVKHLKKIYAA